MTDVAFSHRSLIRAAIDLDDPAPHAELCRVNPGGGAFEAARLVVRADGEAAIGFDAGPDAALAAQSPPLAPGAHAALLIDRAALRRMLCSQTWLRAAADPRCLRVVVDVERQIGTGRSQAGRLAFDLSVGLTPPLPDLTVGGRSVDLQEVADTDAVAVADVEIRLPEGLPLAAPDWHLSMTLSPSALPPAAFDLVATRSAGCVVMPEPVDAGPRRWRLAFPDRRALIRPQPLVLSLTVATAALERQTETTPDLAVGLEVALSDGSRRAAAGVRTAIRADPTPAIGVRLGEQRRHVRLGAGPQTFAPIVVEIGDDGTDQVDCVPDRLDLTLPEGLDPAAAAVTLSLADPGGSSDLAPAPQCDLRALCDPTVSQGRPGLAPGSKGRSLPAPDSPGLARDRSSTAADGDPGNRPDGSGPRGVTVPVTRLLAETGLAQAMHGRDSAAPVLEIELRIAGTAAPQILRLPLEVRRRTDDLPVCIDFGTSAIAVWVGRSADGDRGDALQRLEMRQLELGRWHALIDAGHDEAVPDGPLYLLPSHVGLGSRQNLRLRDPARLGDIALVLPGDQATAARLAHLGRRHDISLPFPVAANLHAHLGEVVFDLKRRLTLGIDRLTLDAPVLTRDPATGALARDNRIDVPSFFAECVDELLALYVSRAVAARYGRRGDRALPDLKLVMTHPSGVGGEQVDRYAAALAPVLARFGAGGTGGAAFYPEALAAARYAAGQPEFRERMAASERSGRHVLIGLDIGAGTADAAITRLDLRDGASVGWSALSTFGLPLGGVQLDAAIADAVLDLLAENAARGRLPVEIAAAGRGDDPAARRIWFGRWLRKGKAALTEALLSDGGAFVWRNGDHRLTLCLYDGDAEIGIVRPPPRLSGALAMGDTPLRRGDDEVGRLRYRFRPGGGGVQRIELDLERRFFETVRPGPALSDPARIVAALGRDLADMALETAGRLAPGIPATLVVTGRTALWPPLFEAVSASAAARGVGLLSPRPFDPLRMKSAVVAGAMTLAEEFGYGAVPVENASPIAAVGLSRRSRGEGAGAIEIDARAETIAYLEAGNGGTTVAGDDVRLGRCLPGLTPERLARLDGLVPGGALFRELRRASGRPLGPVLHGGRGTIVCRGGHRSEIRVDVTDDLGATLAGYRIIGDDAASIGDEGAPS